MMNLYENNIAVTVSPILADELKDYSARIKDPEWIRHAFKQAAAANVRKWSYVKAILDSCITAGRITEKPKRNGAKQNGSYSNKTRPKQTAVRATGKGENVADLLGVSEPDDRKSINRLSGGIVGTTS